jgi:hypothetical protein
VPCVGFPSLRKNSGSHLDTMSGTTDQILVKSIQTGFDYEFVNNLADEYMCKICYLAVRNPVQTKCCGHRFCKTCLDEAFKRSGSIKGNMIMR